LKSLFSFSAELFDLPLKNRKVQRKIQIFGGKQSLPPENENFSWRIKTSARPTRPQPSLCRSASAG
jgi:hypothetical protein